MKPLIGVSANVSPPDDPKRSFSKGVALHYIQEHYLSFIEAGGGIPLIIAPTAVADAAAGTAARLDGLILSGGSDIDPSLYGEENSHASGCNVDRDRFEIALVDQARQSAVPMLCVCRGMQLLNVALGGSLHQDIPTMIPDAIHHHSWEDGRESFHQVNLAAGSILSEIFEDDRIEVNSSHHQSVRRPGEGLAVVATADDGVVEAVASAGDAILIGVQWHPERMPGDRRQRALAKWFVNACRRRRR